MSLTELSYWFRKALPYIVLGILGILIVFYSFRLYFVYLESNKPVVITTNLIFGKIDKPKIQVATTSANLSFTLDTIEGQPVTATDTASIFFLPEIPTRFGYKEKILLMAKNFGFDSDIANYKLVDRQATFSSGDRQLTIDIGNFNFNFKSDVDLNLITSSSVILSKTEIENKAINLLKTIGRYPEELARGSDNITFLKYDPLVKDFVNVENQSEAQAVEVDFFRPDIGNIPVVTPKFFTSQNYVIMIFQGDEEKVIRANISFFEKSEDQVGIYPVKTGDQAWEELKNGNGIVVAGQKGIKNITIKKMSLKYLDPDIYQRFLQPVYEFIGDNDFVAYVPAVQGEYLQ